MRVKFNQKTAWDRLKNCNFHLILYGMGNGAEKVIKQLNHKRIPYSGIMASDDFVRYQDFMGYTVKKLSDFEKKYDDLMICLCFGSDIPEVIDHIYEIAEKHPVIVPSISLFDDEIVDDDFLEKNSEKISKAYDLLSDDFSKKVFLKSLEFLYTGDPFILKEIETSKDDAYTLLDLSDCENYLDLGAYNGDTVCEFINHTEGYSSITAVEPNPKNFEKLIENTKDLRSFKAINKGISDKCGKSFVSRDSGRMATLSKEERKRDTEIDTVTVDSIKTPEPFTYIKADIEGMENEMISGAQNTLKTKPKLCISAYHKASDIFNLILKINDINSSYRFYLRKHRYIPLWDLNLYAK